MIKGPAPPEPASPSPSTRDTINIKARSCSLRKEYEVNEETGLVPFEQKFPLEILWLDGEPLFNARDVAAGLELGDSARKMAIKRMKSSRYVIISNEIATRCSMVTNCDLRAIANRGETFLHEPGLYELAMSSRSEGAERFKDWVFEEVIPSIRKTGSYSTMQVAAPQTYSEALRALADSVEAKEKAERQLLLDAPKVEFFDAVAESKDAVPIGSLAKVLDYPNMGPINLFKFLRQQGVLMSDNAPYQEHIDAGRFRVVEQRYHKPDGSLHIYFKTLVLMKGQQYILRLLKTVVGDNPKK